MKKLYLTFAASVFAVMGLLYGLAPALYLSGLGSQPAGEIVSHVVRSIGGAYLGFSLWLGLTVRRKESRDAAVLSVVAVMAGLVVCRALSFALDDSRNVRLWVSAGIEFAFAAWGLFIIRSSAVK